MSSKTCVATNTPIVNSGAKIVWADIDLETGMIDPVDAERRITNKTKAIVVVDWAGTPCNLEKFQEISKIYSIPIIQDAAHAFGATFRDKPISDFADFTCYSFQAIKHFTTGDGGAIVSNNISYHKLIRKLKWFGFDRDIVKDTKGDWKGQKWDADIKTNEIGFKFNMNNLSAAIGLANLNLISETLEAHRKNAVVYKNILSQCRHIELLKELENSRSSYWVFTLRIMANKEIRDKILFDLNLIGIHAGLVHLPNHYYSGFREFATLLPNTDLFSDTQISLPCGWWLSTQDCEYICENLLLILDRYL